MASKHGRHCSLCRQRYGSGFRDNVAASDVLRARRMLTERSGSDADACRSEIRQGLDLFLDDLTKQRELEGNRHLPLDVCAFCTQFLPSAYHEDALADDVRASGFHTNSHHLQHASRNQHSAGSASRRGRASSLVIQHKFAKTPRPPDPSSVSSPSTDALDSSASRSASSSPPRPSYRLLTNDATRVLLIESPRDGALTVGGSTLLANEATRNLRLQEKQQTAAIFSAARAKHEDALRRRATMEPHESSEPAAALRKMNIVHAIRARGAADSLYTGVVLASHAGASGARKLPAESRVRTHKTGRHFKTELFLPPV